MTYAWDNMKFYLWEDIWWLQEFFLSIWGTVIRVLMFYLGKSAYLWEIHTEIFMDEISVIYFKITKNCFTYICLL